MDETLEQTQTCRECGDEPCNQYPMCSEDNGLCTCCRNGNECDRGGHHTHRDLCDNCSSCEAHCPCSTCSRCLRPFDEVCSQCDCCSRHCECQECPSCGYMSNNCERFCSECEYCNNCCECFEGDESYSCVRICHRSIRWWEASKRELTLNPIKRYISCEIEIANADEGNPIDRVCEKWQCSVHPDDSLPSTGFEIATSPAQGDLFLNQIKELCRALNDCGADLNRKCGLHVHVDAKDFYFWDMRRFILLYSKVENGLFSLVPPSRRAPDPLPDEDYGDQPYKYCLPCGKKLSLLLRGKDSSAMRERLVRDLYKCPNNFIPNKKKEKHGCHDRYRAVNIHSWYYLGSIEFRMGGGSTDFTKITNWSMLLAGLVDYAAKHSDKEVNKLKGDPLDLLKKIAPTQQVREWIDVRFAQLNK